MSETSVIPRIAVDETEAAKAIGMSVHFLRKDRRTKRFISFFRIGDCIHYDLIRVREALAAVEEGGRQEASHWQGAGDARQGGGP